MWLTIIIPLYHDDKKLQRLLQQLKTWQLAQVAVIIVDGQQRPRPQWLPATYTYLTCSQPNRGRQLRLGADRRLLLNYYSYIVILIFLRARYCNFYSKLRFRLVFLRYSLM